MENIIYLISIIQFVYTIYVLKKPLHTLQQNLYNENNRYYRWIFKNKNISFGELHLYALFFAILFIFTINEYLQYLFLSLMIIVYLVSFYFVHKKRKQEQTKKPLVYTKRIKRLLVTILILYIIPYILFIYANKYYDLLLITNSLMIILVYLIVFLANIINYPIERMIYHKFRRQAVNKLKSMPHLKIIGITGSYGKTSTKNILNDILNVKFNSFKTDKSINTFNGIMITINNKLDKFEDIFITEMGAYVKGEINGLCKLVNPKYGIITNIGKAHLETFGSEKNIQTGKMELIEYLPSDGIGVLNKDDINQKDYEIKNPNHCEIVWVGITAKDVDYKATDIKYTNKGCTFNLEIKGDKKKYPMETSLLGVHNIYNILSSIALAHKLGLSIKDITTGVKRVKSIEHRLELKRIGKFYMIDDAYNSNPSGAKAALDVLGLMDGYKVVVTPGMIELGAKEKELNKIFGNQISEVADKVILVGEKQTKPIYEGLIAKKYNKENIIVTNDVVEAYKIINDIKVKEDIYALFENDLPDIYNE